MTEQVEQTENVEADVAELESLIEPDYDPAADMAASEEDKAADKMLKQQCDASAAIAVGIVGSVVEIVAPGIDVPDEQTEKIQEKLSAVMYKYDLELPPWLAAYREELELAGVLAMTGFGVYVQIKRAKALEATQQQEAGNDGKEPQPQAA